jgi:purine-nucleoside phosphorylase
MEAAALYTLAAQYGARALAVCTVSDHIVTGEETTSQERERTFDAMISIALGAALAVG